MSQTEARDLYPSLHVLIAGYFHQDWDLDDPTWQAVASRYVRDATRDEVNASRTELRSLLDTTTREDDLRLVVLHEFGGCYDPSPDSSMRDWLEAVLRQIEPPGDERFGGVEDG